MCAPKSVPSWVELPRETIEFESCVYVAGDSEGEERVSLVLKRASCNITEFRATKNINLYNFFCKCVKHVDSGSNLRLTR
jgi:hypothetical protein